MQGVGAGEVDELEEAALGRGLGEAAGAQAVLVDGDHLARLDLADVGGADDVEGRGLAGHHPAALQAAEDERPDALGVAGGVQRGLVHPDEGVGAGELGQQLGRPLLQRGVGVVGEQRGHQRGVVGAGLELAGVEVELGVAAAGRRPSACRSRVLVRLPLWASAIEPSAVGRKVGWALCQVLAPVVE